MDDRRLPDVPQDGADAAATDDQLLRQFRATRDERAFRQLVERHGGLVLGVCTRILRQRHDAEEAFQATFLVLARKAARVRGGRSLAAWLYGVAYRTAVRAHQRRTRRQMETLPVDAATIDDALAGLWECHWRRALDDALNELPEKLRAPLVLHYLQGKTNHDVATELGLSVRAVEGRQRRGKALLKRRLALRKVGLPLAVSAAAATASAEASAALVEATVSASLAFVTGTSAAGGEGALRLAQNEVNTMSTSMTGATALSAGVILMAALGAAAIGAGGYAVAQGGDSQPLSLAIEAAAAGRSTTNLDPQVDAAAFSAGEPEVSGLLSHVAAGGPDLFRAHRLSDAERRIYAAIESARTTLEFAETPLNTIMGFLSDEYAIPIYFDTRAMDAIAVSPDIEVTVNLRDLPLRSALRLLLREVDELTYVVRDDVLLITTEEEAQGMLETHVYDVTDTIAENKIDVEELAIVIPGAIAPDTWNVNRSGVGTIATLGRKYLVINQTQAVHEEILAFLRQLAAARATPAGEPGR